MKSSLSFLAALSTYKELYSRGKYLSQYQLLAEFIKYIIVNGRKLSFNVAEIKFALLNGFGFELPDAVIRTAIRGIEGTTAKNGIFTVDMTKIIYSDDFGDIYKNAKCDGDNIIKLLYKYVEEQDKKVLSFNDKKDIEKEFLNYISDRQISSNWSNHISMFIMSNENNTDFVKKLDMIRAGCVLYTGLNYNITEMGGWKNKIVLYLDMEILFDLYGYNGTVYKSFADDLLKLIRDANSGEKKISLRYFKETKQAIEKFFEKAEYIVKNKQLVENGVAMSEIVNGCKDASDVAEKKGDFFYKLQSNYGIIEETKDDFYDSKYDAYNLEGCNIDELRKSSDADKKDEYNKSVLPLSHINKLRKGNLYGSYEESEYLFVTETRKTLEWSREFCSEGNVCLAISMCALINYLWNKLNKGFGAQNFPTSVDVVLKAKIILSRFVTEKVLENFYSLKNSYAKKEITQEQCASRMLALREKSVKPEDINSINMEDELNFGDEYLDSIARENAYNRELVKKQQREIEDIERGKIEAIRERDVKLAKAEKMLEQEREEKEALKAVTEKMKETEKRRWEEEQKKIEKYKKIKRRILEAGVAIVVMVVIYFLPDEVWSVFECIWVKRIINFLSTLVLIHSVYKMVKG